MKLCLVLSYIKMVNIRGENKMKPEKVTILQMSSPELETIYGLGDDNKMYKWDYQKEVWEIYG